MIRMLRVLMPLVTVEDEYFSDLFFFLGLSQSFGHQTDWVFTFELMGHDETLLEVFDGGEKDPVLLSIDIGDIRDSFLVGPRGCEISI